MTAVIEGNANCDEVCSGGDVEGSFFGKENGVFWRAGRVEM